MRRSFLLLPVILAFLTASVSCGPKGHEGHEHSAAEQNEAVDAKKYICPMHPDVQSDKPGQCPKCGMALEAQSAS